MNAHPRPGGGGSAGTRPRERLRHGSRFQRSRSSRRLRPAGAAPRFRSRSSPPRGAGSSRWLRPAGAVPQPRLDRWIARRPSRSGKRTRPVRMRRPCRPATSRASSRSGSGSGDRGREGRGQHGDGRRTSPAFPGRGHCDGGYTAWGALPARGEREHRGRRGAHPEWLAGMAANPAEAAWSRGKMNPEPSTGAVATAATALLPAPAA